MNSYASEKVILVIDDDKATQLLIAEILGDKDLTVLQAYRSAEAIPLFQKHHNNMALILLDIMLPGYNGFELLKQLKEINPCVPVVAVSAIPPVDLVYQSRAAGCNAYVSKPFDIGEFRKIIETYLE